MSKPTTENSKFNAQDVKSDFLASIVVFLVALPLCMGIAIASGVPVAAGLITGIIGGIVVAWMAGCPLQVSGPAAGLAVIVYEIVQAHGLEMLGIIVLMAGVIQLLAGIFRIGQWFRAVSPAVIRGMLAGIGVLIFASQFHVMVDDKPKGSGIENLVTIPQAIGKGLTFGDFASYEIRDYRTKTLREVGELHRRQAALTEKIAERLPDHASEEKLESETEAQIAAEAKALEKLLPEQVAIHEDLGTVSERIKDFEGRADDTDKSKAIIAALTLADQQMDVAEADLRDGRVRKALDSQHEAVDSLEGLSVSMKNHGLAAQIGLLTIIVIVVWQGFVPKKLKVVPAPLVAILVAAIAAAIITVPVLYVEVPNNLFSEIRFPTLSIISDAPWVELIKMAAVVAVVASAETLLCATAVDQMHSGPRTKYDKELAAQGVGNILCGVVGSLPMTGVIVRSSANIQAGGKTRLSAFLHGVWLLVFVAGLAFLLRSIPTSALAAILVYTGFKLVNPKSIKDLWKYGKGEVVIYLVTIVTIVCTDLLTGVLVGVALATAKLLYSVSHLRTEMELDTASQTAVLRLHGAATFLRLPKLAGELENIPPSAELHVDLEHLDYIDHACLDLFMNWAKQHESTGGQLVMDWASLHAKFNAEDSGSKSERSESSGPKSDEVDDDIASAEPAKA